MDQHKFNALEAEYRLRELPDPVRVELLVKAVEEANTLDKGDYIEVGTLWGVSAKIIHRAMDPSCTLYAFDTFEGFDQRDLDVEWKITGSQYWQPGFSMAPARDHNFFPTSVESVRRYLGNPDNFFTVQGWFPDSFAGFENVKWRFAHFDVDLYQPTLRALECIWPNLVSGGVVVLHDYGCSEFIVKKAVHEWCGRTGLEPQIMNDRLQSAVLRKD